MMLFRTHTTQSCLNGWIFFEFIVQTKQTAPKIKRILNFLMPKISTFFILFRGGAKICWKKSPFSTKFSPTDKCNFSVFFRFFGTAKWLSLTTHWVLCIVSVCIYVNSFHITLFPLIIIIISQQNMKCTHCLFYHF